MIRVSLIIADLWRPPSATASGGFFASPSMGLRKCFYEVDRKAVEIGGQEVAVALSGGDFDSMHNDKSIAKLVVVG